MTYYSAYFKNLEKVPENLQQAQKNKYKRIIKKLINKNILNNLSLLEIGCGWGGFCEVLIKEYPLINYVGITISEEQYKYCVDKFKNIPNVKFELIDYRLVQGTYDYVVSIEMIEAVGYEYYDEYFKVINSKLSENGEAMIQAITIPDTRFEGLKNNVDFIQKYIFPGGLCPSISVIIEASKKNNLIMTDLNNFGLDYMTTLEIWLDNFKSNINKIKKLGFDDRFERLWEYYLVYCAVGFKNELINLNQIKFKKY
jgi:cyclopropane-fatty-acyl-phospholipid synthase